MKHYERKANGYTFNVEEYGSTYELAVTNRKREVAQQWIGNELTDGDIHSGFHGVNNREEAYQMLQNGWAEKVQETIAKTETDQRQGEKKRQAFKNDVVGFAPIVPLAMMNVPNSMLNTALRQVKSKVIKIVYANDGYGGRSTDDFIKSGQRVMSAIVSLEQNGYRCEIYSSQWYVIGNKVDTLLVKVKEANQPLDIKRAMFPMTHPAMLRVVGFDWEDRCPTSTYDSGRGRVISTIKNCNDVIKKAFGDEFTFIDLDTAMKGIDEVKKAITGGKK